MSVPDCSGRTWCEPPVYPTSLDETWVCPECGKVYEAFDAHGKLAAGPFELPVPPGTLGWRSTGVGCNP
jgi:hypothetical protein